VEKGGAKGGWYQADRDSRIKPNREAGELMWVDFTLTFFKH
jgi:hypothetical protein